MNLAKKQRPKYQAWLNTDSSGQGSAHQIGVAAGVAQSKSFGQFTQHGRIIAKTHIGCHVATLVGIASNADEQATTDQPAKKRGAPHWNIVADRSAIRTLDRGPIHDNLALIRRSALAAGVRVDRRSLRNKFQQSLYPLSNVRSQKLIGE